MTLRRQFLKNCVGCLGGFASLSSDLWRADPSRKAGPAGSNKPIAIAGRPVKTIDMHAHCLVPEVWEIVKDTNLAVPVHNLLDPSNYMHVPVGPERLEKMDAEQIGVQVLSVNPFWYTADRALAERIINFQNAKLAEMCAAYPDRFVALATVSLQHPDLAAKQLEDGVRHMSLRGASIGGSVAGKELSSADFDIFWAKAEELQCVIFIHPQGSPEIQARTAGNGALGNVIGNPLETSIALAHLIFEGSLDRFPGLKVCAAHGGGYLPSYSGRMDHGCLVFPEQCKGIRLKKEPTEYLKQLYFDSLVFTPEALRHLIAVCGASQIVIGTDYPYPWVDAPVNQVLATPGLNNAERVEILGGTAAKLLKITS